MINLSVKFVVVMVFLIGSMSIFSTELITQVIAEENTLYWGYVDNQSPDKWGKISPDFALCELGKNQSPININNSVEGSSIKIDFNYKPTPLSITNTGHTVQINYQPGSSIKINEEEYELLQFHFHTPSEHTINNQLSAMEMHLVHRNANNELAVVGVMMSKGARNPFIEKIWQYIPEFGESNNFDDYTDNTINAADLLPKNKGFFSYIGSLTTPPCTENVQWSLLMDVTEVSEGQIKAFQKLYNSNARPLQSVNGRRIELYR